MEKHNTDILQNTIIDLEDELEQSTKQLEYLSLKLLEAESHRSNFLSHILNEINNPLTSILGLTNNIRQMAYSNPDLVHKQANLAYEQAFELDYKMRNIFAAAAIEGGTVAVRPGKVDVHKMLEGIIQDFQFKLKCKDLEISLSIEAEDQPYINTDAGLFHAMLLNLIGNAVEFSPSKSEIKITLDVTNSGVVFTIEDEGVGISKDDQKLIFGRFKQLDEGVTKSHQGTGLGLSIVKEYIDLLGGTLEVASELNKGSLFTLVLPEITNLAEAFEEASFGEDELF